jgi:hypothetical protein
MVTVAAPVSIYQGDRKVFPPHAFKVGVTPYDFVAAGYTDWACTWESRSGVRIDLDVSTSQPEIGVIRVIADTEATSVMTESGAWDVQAIIDGQPRTWFRGTTLFTADVTR